MFIKTKTGEHIPSDRMKTWFWSGRGKEQCITIVDLDGEDHKVHPAFVERFLALDGGITSVVPAQPETFVLELDDEIGKIEKAFSVIGWAVTPKGRLLPLTNDSHYLESGELPAVLFPDGHVEDLGNEIRLPSVQEYENWFLAKRAAERNNVKAGV